MHAMNYSKLISAVVGLLLTAPLALAPTPDAQADDIDICTRSVSETQAVPLVVLGLDLNMEVAEVACSNVLANPDSLSGQPACEAIQQLVALPVLEIALGRTVGTLTEALEAAGDLTSLLGDLSGATTDTLTNALTDIVGTENLDDGELAITNLDVVRLILYRLLHQLVGVRVAIMANNASTCEMNEFSSPRRNTDDCSNGAFLMLDADKLLESDIDTILSDVIGQLQATNADDLDEDEEDGDEDGDENVICHIPPGNPDARQTISVGNQRALRAHLRHGDTRGPCEADEEDQGDLSPPYQGKEVYYELVRYLTGQKVYNSRINADNGLPFFEHDAVASGDTYNSPLDGNTCETIHMVNVMFTNSQDDDESDNAILNDGSLQVTDADNDGDLTWPEMTTSLDNDGFTHNNGRYRIKSYYLVNGLQGDSLLDNLVGTAMDLPIAGNPLALPLVSRENFLPTHSINASFGGPQPVFARSDMSQADDALYTGMFRPDPDRSPAWPGNLKKLELDERQGELEFIDQREQLTHMHVVFGHAVVIFVGVRAGEILVLCFYVRAEMHAGRVPPAHPRPACFVLAFNEVLGRRERLLVDGLHPLPCQRARVFDLLLASRQRLALEYAAGAELLEERLAVGQLQIRGIVAVFRLFLGVEVVQVAQEFVEPVHGGQVCVEVALVILAKLPGGVALGFEHRGEGYVGLLPSLRSVWHANFGHARANRHAAVEKRRPAGGATLLAVVVGEADALRGNPVDVRRAVAHHAAVVVADVPGADVIAPDNQDIRFVLGLRGAGGQRACQHGQQAES